MIAIAIAIAGAAAGCAQKKPAPMSTGSAGDAGAAAIASAEAEIDAAPPLPEGPWADAVRAERWDDAWRGLEALADAEKTRPEMRYVRARVAAARGEDAVAIDLLANLEAQLPLLADRIARRRAESEGRVGPFDAAAEYLTTRRGAAAQLQAALAFERAGKADRARAAAERVLGEKHSRAQETAARALRLRLAEGDAAEADARWIATRAPDLPEAKEADQALAKLGAGGALSNDDLLVRARALADAGHGDEAARTVERAWATPGRKMTALEKLRAKADVLFRAKKYLDAAHVFRECVAAAGAAAPGGTNQQADDALHVARSLSRGEHDDDALVAYRSVVTRWPKTPAADEAAFLGARLHLLHGRWDAAATAFDAYARDYPNGAERKEAARGRGLAHLANKTYGVARRLFEQMADEETDPVSSGRALTMAALAASRDGDRTHAVARWTEVARSRPLTWPALVARARLTEAGAPLPPPIDPPSTGEPPAPLALRLPPPVDRLHALGLDDEAEDALRDREGALGATVPGRQVEALCTAYGEIGRARFRAQVAQQILGATFATAPSARTRWSWDCAFPTPFEAAVRGEETTLGLPYGLVYAVMRQESQFDPDVVSPARAVGLLQLLPETARAVATTAHFPIDEARLTSPPYNIALGARYLRELLDKYHGVVPLAVASYNAGPEAVTRWMQRTPEVDLDVFVERIPYAETRGYVVRVMGNLARYAYLGLGEAGMPTIPLALK